MIKINLPCDEKTIRSLNIGDDVLISGVIVTARDRAHKYLCDEKPEEYKQILAGTFIYHCGPIMKKINTEWKVIAAGPTTSIREEPYEAFVIQNYNIKGIIGKGGMGPKTLKALKDFGGVYLHTIGGLAQILAQSVVKVPKVLKLEEFGSPEAFWFFEVKDFPARVTMDSKGKSLHDEVLETSKKNLAKILETI
jgi:fumarate hydratase class I